MCVPFCDKEISHNDYGKRCLRLSLGKLQIEVAQSSTQPVRRLSRLRCLFFNTELSSVYTAYLGWCILGI